MEDIDWKNGDIIDNLRKLQNEPKHIVHPVKKCTRSQFNLRGHGSFETTTYDNTIRMQEKNR